MWLLRQQSENVQKFDGSIFLMYPIYIVSKGRAETISTPKVLDTVGIPYTFVLEQQEYEAYRHHFPQSPVVVLPESHKGIAYVRNWLLQYAAQQGHTWYWMMDDDIRGFWKVERGEYVPADATVLLGAEKATTWENIVQVSLCTKWKSGPARKDQYVLNTDCSR